MNVYRLMLLAFALTVFRLDAAPDTRLFEMRVYYANQGKLDALHARFRDHTLKLFERHGMINIGYWVPEENTENKLTYVLAYPNREARDKSWKAFLEDPDWTAAYQKSIAKGKLVAKVDSTFMKTVPYSPPIKAGQSNPARHFELRTYITHPGKLKNLDARFRENTMAIFRKHGMKNLAYWHVMTKEGAGNTLVYLLGFPDKAAQKKAWEGFGKDPAWRKVYTASVAKGKLVKRVLSVNLVPTDYSPMQ